MKKLLLEIVLMSFSFFVNAQIGLQAGVGAELFLVEKIMTKPITKIDLTTLHNHKTVSPNLQPTWSFSESIVYDNHFGFFCKVEVKLDKVSKMQTRFRLGSVDYVNELEGK